jgi:hypothetical protein
MSIDLLQHFIYSSPKAVDLIFKEPVIKTFFKEILERMIFPGKWLKTSFREFEKEFEIVYTFIRIKLTKILALNLLIMSKYQHC